jgi:hypothetical protein
MKISLYFLFFLSLSGYAQKKVKTLELSDTIVFAAVDRPGDLYVITKSGQMQKFDEDGKLKVVYKNKSVPTLFDPRDGSRLFAYYRNLQQYAYLNPSFEEMSAFHIDSAFVIQPWLISPSGDHKLWVLDAADNSLKRINVNQSVVETEVLIDSIIHDVKDFTTIREYQGFVFLLHPEKGIVIFNALGRHIKTIAAQRIAGFNFLGEELYYQEGGKLKFFDLFSADTREVAGDKAGFTLITDRRIYLVKTKSIDILTL